MISFPLGNHLMKIMENFFPSSVKAPGVGKGLPLVEYDDIRRHRGNKKAAKKVVFTTNMPSAGLSSGINAVEAFFS